jgi:DNA-binding MarR family transcriptional regulator
MITHTPGRTPRSPQFNDPDASPLPSIDERIVVGLQQLSRAVMLSSERESFRHQLSGLQSQLLLSLLKPHHATTIGGLATELNLSAPTLSDAARVLLKKGLVRKRHDPRDGRIVRLSLTGRGRAVTGKLMKSQAELQRIVASLAGEEKEKLLSLLVTLTKGFLDRGLIPISRMCKGCQFFMEDLTPGSNKPHYCAFAEVPIGESALQTDCPDHIPLTLITAS